MNFLRRLKFYGIGFGIGLLMVYAIFGTRSCTTPNEMKMQELVFQYMRFSEKALCKLHCMKKNELLLKVELRHFEVNYELSKVHEKDCGEYFVQPKKEFAAEHPYDLIMYDCDTITEIRDIHILTPATCTCQ